MLLNQVVVVGDVGGGLSLKEDLDECKENSVTPNNQQLE